jgi:hypothetical protein
MRKARAAVTPLGVAAWLAVALLLWSRLSCPWRRSGRGSIL